MAEDIAPCKDPNIHVKQYLAYYFSLAHAPHYAVLINGPWGIGKTYLIRKILREHFGNEGSFVYISLFGLTSIDEVDATLFQAIYPPLAWKTTKLASRAIKAGLKFLRIDFEMKIGELINKADRAGLPNLDRTISGVSA